MTLTYFFEVMGVDFNMKINNFSLVVNTITQQNISHIGSKTYTMDVSQQWSWLSSKMDDLEPIFRGHGG